MDGKKGCLLFFGVTVRLKSTLRHMGLAEVSNGKAHG